MTGPRKAPNPTPAGEGTKKDKTMKTTYEIVATRNMALNYYVAEFGIHRGFAAYRNAQTWRGHVILPTFGALKTKTAALQLRDRANGMAAHKLGQRGKPLTMGVYILKDGELL